MKKGTAILKVFGFSPLVCAIALETLSIGLTPIHVCHAAEPDISVTPLVHDFGVECPTYAEPPIEATVSNTGSEDPVISGMGPLVGIFDLHVNRGSNPCNTDRPTLAPGGSCTKTTTDGSVL